MTLATQDYPLIFTESALYGSPRCFASLQVLTQVFLFLVNTWPQVALTQYFIHYHEIWPLPSAVTSIAQDLPLCFDSLAKVLW